MGEALITCRGGGGLPTTITDVTSLAVFGSSGYTFVLDTSKLYYVIASTEVSGDGGYYYEPHPAIISGGVVLYNDDCINNYMALSGNTLTYSATSELSVVIYELS